MTHFAAKLILRIHPPWAGAWREFDRVRFRGGVEMRWGGRPPLVGAESGSCAEQGRGAVRFRLAGDARRGTGLGCALTAPSRDRPSESMGARGRSSGAAGPRVKERRQGSSVARLGRPKGGLRFG